MFQGVDTLTSYQVFRNTVIIIMTVIFAYLLFLTTRVTVVLLAAIIIASAVRPLVMRLKKWRVPHGVAIVFVYAFIALSVIVLIVAVLPPMINQIAGYLQDDDRLANRIVYAQYTVERLIYQNTGQEIELLERDDIRQAVSDALDEITATAPSMINDVSAVLGDFILIFVMGIYWLTSRDRAVDFILNLMPMGKRDIVNRIISEIEEGMGSYVRGIIIVSIIVGLLNFAILALLRVPNAATLGFLAGVITAVPIVGGILGVAITTTLALLTSPLSALIVFLTTVGVQQVENYVLTPRIMSRSVGFDEIFILVLVAAGFTLNGIVGALLAVPLAGAAYILVRYLVLEPRRNNIKPETVKGGVLLQSDLKKKPETPLEPQENPTTA